MPAKSGAEFHADSHARFLISRGHDVSIFTRKKYFFTKAHENWNGIDLVRLHGGFRWSEVTLRLLTTHRDFDAFYIIGVPKFAVWAVKAAHLLKKPVTMCLTINEEIFSDANNWRTKIFKTCDHFVAISNEIKRGLSNFVDENKIVRIPQGIDTRKFPKFDENHRRELKKSFGIDPESKVVLFLARISLRKGVDTLQKVWTQIHEKMPSAKLFIVGGGFSDLIEQLKNFSANVDNSVVLTGEIDDPAEFYQMSDVYFFPSRGEGLPTSLMEAMSSGLPAVVSNIGGNEDLIFDYENGFRIETENVDGYVEKIIELLSDDELRLKLGNNAAEFVRKYCDFEKIIPDFEDVLANENVHDGALFTFRQ